MLQRNMHDEGRETVSCGWTWELNSINSSVQVFRFCTRVEPGKVKNDVGPQSADEQSNILGLGGGLSHGKWGDEWMPLCLCACCIAPAPATCTATSAGAFQSVKHDWHYLGTKYPSTILVLYILVVYLGM